MLFFGLLVGGLALSGPIAFIWCMVLSFRISRIETEKDILQGKLYRLQERMLAVPGSENVSSGIREKAKHTATDLYGVSPQRGAPFPVPPASASPPSADIDRISDPAARTAAQWAQAVAPYRPPNTERPSTETIEKVEPEPSSKIQAETPPKKPLPTENLKQQSIFESVSSHEPETSEQKTPLKQPMTPASAPRPLGDLQWEKRHPAPQPNDGGFSWQSLELLIGRKVLGWVAVIGFILSATFFIRYAVQEGWIAAIPASLKVLGIAAFGGVFLITGKYFSNKNWRRFSTMLSSAGMIIVFQAGYASHAVYELLSLTGAGAVLSSIILGGFLLAWHYQSKLLGIVSILGGLAVPLLLSTGTDRHPQFFVYLTILNLGTVMLVGLLGRAPIAWLAFFGTQAEFWLWYDRFYVHPDKLGPVLLFQAAFYAVYLLDTTIASLIPWGKLDWMRTSVLVRRLTIRDQLEQSDEMQAVPLQPTWDDAVRAILAPILFFGTIWLLLRDDPVFGDWLGIFAFAGAAWYALLATVFGRQIQRLWDRETDRRFSAYWKAGPTAATVISLGFVAIGIPLQFAAHWIALGWTAVFAGLWYFGHRQENRAFIILSYIFAGLGFVRLANDIFWTRSFSIDSPPWPVWNIDAMPPLVASLVVMTATVLTHRLFDRREIRLGKAADARTVNFGFGLLGYGVLAAVLSVEAVQYFTLRPERFVPGENWASLSLTILWGLLAWTLLEAGLRCRSFSLRSVSLTAFFVVALKMLLVDFAIRSQFSEPITNPFCPGLIFTSLLLIGDCVRASTSKRLEEGEQNGWSVLGVIGVFSLLGILSVECYHYVFKYFERIPMLMLVLKGGEWSNRVLAFNSLSLLWTLYGLSVLAIGLTLKNRPARVCGGIVLLGTFFKIGALELLRRPDYAQVLVNPYFLSILCPTLAVMLAAVWTTWFKPLENKQEREFFKTLGVVGVLFFWTILSVECFTYFDRNPLSIVSEPGTARFVATASLTVLWTMLALTLIGIGVSSRLPVLRCLGLLVFGAIVAKILVLELFRRPAFETALLNPYFLPILIASTVMIVAAVWTTRFRPLDNPREKNAFLAFGLVGIILIWAVASIECFQYFNIRADWPHHRFLASSALTVFWTVLGIMLAVIGLAGNSRSLRILGGGMLALTLLKVLPLDLFARPDYLTPMFNPYALPQTLLALAMISIGVALVSKLGKEDDIERRVYQTLTFVGVVFLWSVLSLECFRSVRLLQGAESEAWKAQMALSILWSVFAGVLIFAGFVWRSSILRWMAILLFAATLTKVLVVDMAGVHELYRFGAIFVLASVLTLAAWAYQRFKPEKTALPPN